MTWDNYAHDTWHIDHIVPLSSFLFDTPDDPGFKSAWALANLQPLWAKENMSKGNRLDHPSTVSALAANDNLPLKFAA
jgi:5-methylcytosine-specific restriction endonuclease McrA